MSICISSSDWQKPFAAALFFLTISGCGPGGYSGPTGKVSGKVSYKGAALPAGTSVAFLSADGFVAAGVTDAGGAFKLMYNGTENVPVGTYNVQLGPPAVSAPAEFPDPSKPLSPAAKSPFPSKYAASSTSGLQFPIKAGDNPPIDIILE